MDTVKLLVQHGADVDRPCDVRLFVCMLIMSHCLVSLVIMVLRN